MRLDPFYPIFDSTEWLSRLLPLGIKLVQLRIKDMPENRLRQEIEPVTAADFISSRTIL